MKKETLRDMLAVFTEGVIEELSYCKKDLNFKIECAYLANIVSPKFKFFYGTLKNVQDVYYLPWDDENVIITSIKEIESLKPDILNVEVDENDYIKISGNCSKDFTGGNLFIKADYVKIYSEEFELLSQNDLLELSDKFWYSSNVAE
jgi:hypothetical protein